MDFHHWWVHFPSFLPAFPWLTSGIEGLITVVISVFLYFTISDFPEEAKWLSEEEKVFVKQRLSEDVGNSGHHVKYGIKDVLGVFKDRRCCTSAVTHIVLTSTCIAKILIGGLMYLGQVVPACECGMCSTSRLTFLTILSRWVCILCPHHHQVIGSQPN